MKRLFEKWCKEVFQFEPGVYFAHEFQAGTITIQFNKWLRGEKIYGRPRFPHWYSANKFQVLKWTRRGIGRNSKTA